MPYKKLNKQINLVWKIENCYYKFCVLLFYKHFSVTLFYETIERKIKGRLFIRWLNKFLALVWKSACEIANESLRSCYQAPWWGARANLFYICCLLKNTTFTLINEETDPCLSNSIYLLNLLIKVDNWSTCGESSLEEIIYCISSFLVDLTYSLSVFLNF